VIGSYVPDGIEIGRWLTQTVRGALMFYDIDTPVTLAALEDGTCTYLAPELIGSFDAYLSFTGGPTLDRIVERWGARRAVAFYCMVDEDAYAPVDTPREWEVGYLGTYGADRQPKLNDLLFDTARARPEDRFVVAGPQYPDTSTWPANVTHIEHLAPAQHPHFYAAQRFTLNVTRADMVRAGWSPSVRLFEAAACGVPIISDRWHGIDEFFEPGREIVLAGSSAEVLDALRRVDDEQRQRMAAAARRRVLRDHTAARRAEELERHALDAFANRASR
jgi:spore maturation protein CgeB